MCDAVPALGIEFCDPELLDEYPHTPHRIGRRDTRRRYGMIRDHGDLVGIEDASRCLVAACNAEDDIKVDDKVEIRHYDVARRNVLRAGMRRENLLRNRMSHEI